MTPPPVPRRHFLHTLGLGSLAGVLPAFEAWAQAAPKTAAALPPLNRLPGMMQAWLLRQMEAAGPRVEEWKTEAEALAYVQGVRRSIRECFGPLPEKTPLEAKVTGSVEREAYRLEKVVFASRPGYFVSANLYVPKGRELPVPGVVGLCGHAATAKAFVEYQSYAQGLARQGYVVLIIDPIGQGERIQWPDGWAKSTRGGGTREHLQMGNVMCLLGEFLGTWFAWDGIRALDYLLTRPEVDPRHLGVTGQSGGGTQTTWLAALEDRWTMAAPCCFITSFRHNAENELPADTEQCPPKVLRHRLEQCDFLACLAPKPVIILAQEKDFFDVRGSVASYERLKKLYTALGQPEKIQLHIGPDQHSYSQPSREAMYRFFNKFTGVSHEIKEPAIVVEKDEVLWSAPQGNVAALGSRTLISFTAARAAALEKSRRKLTPTELPPALRALLHLPTPPAPLHYRILRAIGRRGYPAPDFTCYAVRTEPEIEILVTRLTTEAGFTSRPATGIPRAVLYISHRSADEELRREPLIAALIAASPGATVYACDVRGIGESQPNTCGANTFLTPGGSHYFYAAHGLMLGRPLLGQRTHDVLRAIDWLLECGHEEVHLAGRGWGALPAAFAALLHGKVTQVTLKHALSSYAALLADPDHDWPAALLLPEVLPRFDLPEVYAALQTKRLQNLEPWGARDGMKA